MQAGPPNAQMQAHIARRRQFFTSLAQAHFARGQPLPQQFTGLNTPGFDPSSSPWNRLPLGNDVGKLRINGRDVDLFALFGIIVHNKGCAKVLFISPLCISSVLI